jgi:nitroreductase
MTEPETVVADLFEAIGTQRAMRRLKPDPVPKGHVKKILWAATRAPNGGNVQPWRFLVVVEGEKKKRLPAMYAEQWAMAVARTAIAKRILSTRVGEASCPSSSPSPKSGYRTRWDRRPR